MKNKIWLKIFYLLFSAIFFYFVVYSHWLTRNANAIMGLDGFDKIFLLIYFIVNIVYFLFGVGVLKTNTFSNISLLLSSILVVISYIVMAYYSLIPTPLIMLSSTVHHMLNPYIFWPISIIILLIGVFKSIYEKIRRI